MHALVEGDLAFLGSIASDPRLRRNPATPLHQKIFGTVAGPAYLNFFNSRVLRADSDACGGVTGVIACTTPLMPTWMYFTSAYLTFSMPQIMRVSILLHEARHEEIPNRNWPHATCPTPFRDERGNDIVGFYSKDPLQGTQSCDSTPIGSYGTQLIFLANIAKSCTNCTDKVRADARFLLQDQLGRILGTANKNALRQDLGL